MNKKIFFINPPTPLRKKIIRNTTCASESKGNYLLQPYDFILLSGVFPKECNIQYVDGLADNLTKEQIIEKLKTQKFDLVITAVIDRLWDHDLAFLKSLSKFTEDKNIPVLIFGDAFLEKNNCEEAIKYADGIIASPFDLKPELILSSAKEELRNNPDLFGLKNYKEAFSNISKKSQLKKINIPRHELFLKSEYRFPFSNHKKYSTVNLSWGCPYSCDYCPASNLPSYFREADDVFNEIKDLVSKGIKEIYFADFSFGVPLENTKKLLKLIIDNNLKFDWSTYFHPNQFNTELLTLMKQSGCHTIITGIETANLRILENFNRTTSKNQITSLINFANEIKINICADFIIGLPGETEKDILNTIKFATSLNIDYASFNIASPLPGSKWRNEFGTKQGEEIGHHFDSMGGANIIPLSEISALDLLRLKNLAVRSFYLRPIYLIKRMLKLRSFEHFIIQFEEMLHLLFKAS